MARFLDTVGKTTYRKKWWVVGFWVVTLGILGWAAVNFMGPVTNSIAIPGTQAQQTLDRFNEIFPETGAKSGKVVIEAPEGQTLVSSRPIIEALTQDLAGVEGVTTAISPFMNPAALSTDAKIGFITVQLTSDGDVIPDETLTAIDEKIAAHPIEGGVVVVGGDLVQQGVGEILGIGEVAGVVVALIVLVVTLGSLVAAGLPIIIAIVTVGVSMAGLFALSSTIELTNTAPVLAVMLGLAVGIDYSLFIINRYRTFLLEGYDMEEAAGKAIATAGNAVLFAAATVVIALSALSVVQIPFMTTMGLAAAATVALAALIAVTLVPALLGIVKLRVVGKKARQKIRALQEAHSHEEQQVSHSTFWYRLIEWLLRYRAFVLVGAFALIAVLAWPASQLKLGLPTAETAAEGTQARIAYDLLEKGFGAGYNAPLLVVVEGMPRVSADIVALSPLAAYAGLQEVSERIADIEGVAGVQPALVTDGGTKGLIQVTPEGGPSDEVTLQLVNELRADDTQKEIARGADLTFGVTGTTALQIDINTKLAEALPLYLSVVIGLSLLLLLVAFRSVLIPLKATLGFLLSVLAMFGALVAVFQWGWFGIAEAPGPIVSFIPIIAIGILFGLAMDYEFFLVSSMQEAYHSTKNARAAVLRGYAVGSRVVVAAGLIMVAVFAGFIGNHDATIQSIGFALALGILVDAFIVRLLLVPIIMSYLGKAAWWIPKWLEKRLPKVSIEGEL